MSHVLADHGLHNLTPVASWPRGAGAAEAAGRARRARARSAASRPPTLAVISEQDILGDRLVRPRRASQARRTISSPRRRASPPAISSCTSITASAASSACRPSRPPARRTTAWRSTTPAATSCILPVENIELLSRYGSEDTGVELDRLGGAAWQTRKARMKKRIREIAGELIKIAAARQLREAPQLDRRAPALYDEFCARFPYEETEDQQTAIDATLDDLAAGRPMDRLICGDVGFGKTEVALRAAFVAAMTGKQVAVVVPTTLLARQHYQDLHRALPRLSGQGRAGLAPGRRGRARQASRRASPTARSTSSIGTHALLGKAIKFKDLGLRDRRRGAAFRRRAQGAAEAAARRRACADADRDADPAHLAAGADRRARAVDHRHAAGRPAGGAHLRLAVRSASWCARRCCASAIAAARPSMSARASTTSPSAKDFLDKNVPEVRVAVAHGQMPPTELEDIMTAFYDGKYDVLLSTTIVESGLDIPTANTLIVHRADMFGLAQLYQLRGRVGRSKTARLRAVHAAGEQARSPPQAERRLKVLQSLDTLGAGFQLATHDLDIRGAGNLLGDEQSGHIKEVGFELYQQMLEEAVASLKAGIAAPVADRWSPQITIGTPVLIPEDYVADLPVRLALYRRLAELEDEREIDAFAAELIDRFGPLPEEVEHLLQDRRHQGAVPARQCREDRGRAEGRGAVASATTRFANPEGLIAFIREQGAGGARAARHEGRVLRRLGEARAAAQGHHGDPAPSRAASPSSAKAA